MDQEMQVEVDAEGDTTSSGFIFSRPNIIPSPEKVVNFGVFSDNVFGGRSTQLPEASFVFAKPAFVEKLDYADEANVEVQTKKIQKPSPFCAPDSNRSVFAQLEKSKRVGMPKSPKSRKTSAEFSAEDVFGIKKTSTFGQLEKNSKKNQNVRLELSNSITCSEVPETLLHKAIAKDYFDQFGETLKITIRPRRKMITVYYATKDGANKAFSKSGKILGYTFITERTTPELLSKPKKKETVKRKIASILNIDDDVKEELEALRGLEYNLPDTQNLKALTTIAAKAKVKKAKVLANANKETPKRTLPLDAKPLMKAAKPIIKPEKSLSKVEVPIPNKTIKISLATIEELQSQVRQAGTTSEEKYKILDARDRLMKIKQGKQQNLAIAKVTKGTCPDMCPEKERYMREFQRQLSSYEQVEGDYKINHGIAVKQYSRSSADQEEPMPHDLRPVKSLKMTMSYLLHEISDLCEDDDANLTEWYHFLWDRMRSIRKDITQQELCCQDTVELVEQCARFHILASERLCAEEASVFDPKINSENLTKCLQTLKYMYHDLREHGISCKNEPEFRAYIILLNLNNGTFISDLSTLSHSVQHSSEVKFALDVYSAIAMNNYSRFFKLVRKTTYLNGCILLRYFNQVRVKALSVMVKAYCRTSGNTEYPLYELIDILGFEDEDEVFDFCSRVGLKCDKESLYIKLNKESFRTPNSNMEQGRAYNLILSKRLTTNQSVGVCIAGGYRPEKTYENHKPHSSFDANGYLLPSSINAQDQNLVDPYEFMEDDVQFVSETKEIKPVNNKVLNNAEDKKQPKVASARITNTEFSIKPKPEMMSTTAPTISKTFPTKINENDFIPKTSESTFFTPPANAASNIFAKPPQTIFSAIPTKPSVMPVNSPFSMTVNKSIFSGNTSNQTNLFKQPTIPSSNLNLDSSKVDVSSTNRQSTKRRLEDSETSVEKRSLTEKEEQQQKQREQEERLKAEKEKMKRLQKINKHSTEQYEILENEVIENMCSSLVEAELERIKLIDTLSEKIYDGMVQEICEGILDEQLFIQDMLIEVERRLHDKLVNKYYRIWKQWASKRRAQRREALDNTPVWLQPESIEERARKLYHPEQKVAIKYARENKRKSLVEEEKKVKHTPIEFIVNVGLKENAKSFDVESSQHAFWKMVISWPLLENRLTLWRHKKVVNKYLSPEDYTLEPIIIQHKPSIHETLDICIRHFEGLICENCLTGMDGLLFIVSADEEPRSVERRLTKSVLAREKLMPIPLVIVVFGDESNDPQVMQVAPITETLLESGYVSEYTILYERSIDEDVVLRVVQSATLWLAINKSPAVPLEMDYLKKVFDDCLTEELWLRIQGHLSCNPQFSKAMNDPNFIISLHNEAVNHVMDIILDPESMAYTDFAPELKIYLGNKQSYPCTYEYFDVVWKHPDYRAELERIMTGFIFPPWKHAWPIQDMMELHDAISTYCHQMLSYENSLSITNNILSDLFLISDHNDNNCSSFSDVILHILSKKISDIGGNTRVVYNKNHIKHFQTLPWWFKSSILMDYASQQQEEIDETASETESLRVSQEVRVTDLTSQMDLDDFASLDINELSESCRQEDDMPLEEFCRETRIRVSQVQEVANKFERQLEEQRLRNQSFEAKLLEALQDDVLGSGS